MRIPKLQVLAEAGVVRAVAARYQTAPAGWTVQVTYASRTGERREVLERQRGGVRVFATLDAVARNLAGLGLPAFQVDATGLTDTGEEPP
jgi:hypothetical protein